MLPLTKAMIEFPLLVRGHTKDTGQQEGEPCEFELNSISRKGIMKNNPGIFKPLCIPSSPISTIYQLATRKPKYISQLITL